MTKLILSKLILLIAIGFVFQAFANAQTATQQSPNVLLIYADDLGYGDISCYNDQSKVQTNRIDQLAKEGLRLTDAHSAATVCTPSRYSLLTGRYAFRLPNHGRVFAGIWGPNLITPERTNLATMMKSKGYSTACIGKWHLGMTFFDENGKPINEGGKQSVHRIDYDRAIAGSPIHRGFDRFFGTVACPTTDWLYAFVDQDRIPTPPSGPLDKTDLPKHPYANDNRPGLKADDFDLEEVDSIFLKKSIDFLESHVAEKPNEPFFLFHSTQAVHLPSFPGDAYKGKTTAGPHGDFIHQLDDHVGQLLDTLKRLKVDENTIVIFTSDNGPETTSIFHMRTDHQHDGARPWRGVKRDNWEGGHRVPFIVRWPGRIKPNTTNNHLVCQTDILATLATILDFDIPSDSGEDSFDQSNSWLGKSTEPVRDHIIHQGFAGAKKLVLRESRWKYLNHTGSGGNRYENNRHLKTYVLPNNAPDAPAQLYDMENDPGETKNLYFEKPDIVQRMEQRLNELKESGRSTK